MKKEAGHFRDINQKLCEASRKTTFPGRRRGDSNPPYGKTSDTTTPPSFGKSNPNRHYRPLACLSAGLQFLSFPACSGIFSGHERPQFGQGQRDFNGPVNRLKVGMALSIPMINKPLSQGHGPFFLPMRHRQKSTIPLTPKIRAQNHNHPIPKGLIHEEQ